MSRLDRRDRDFLQRLWFGQTLRLADREEDRVRQKMRKAGLAVVMKNPRRWELTEAGRAALRERVRMYEPNYHYIPCRCFSADHLVRVCPDEDIDGTLNVEILSSRQSSFWSRVRWALKHVFGREDLVFRCDCLAGSG